ncbi:hypothetical protein KM043_014888 [Ampulex compressa]|nr:hypothetical protein KM043_014888 [Ampulex compressa]
MEKGGDREPGNKTGDTEDGKCPRSLIHIHQAYKTPGRAPTSKIPTFVGCHVLEGEAGLSKGASPWPRKEASRRPSLRFGPRPRPSSNLECQKDRQVETFQVGAPSKAPERRDVTYLEILCRRTRVAAGAETGAGVRGGGEGGISRAVISMGWKRLLEEGG